MLKTRVITALIVGGVVCALLILADPFVVMCLMGVGAGICAYELSSMLFNRMVNLSLVQKSNSVCFRFYPVIVAIVEGISFCLLALFNETNRNLALELIGVIFALYCLVLVFSRKEVQEVFVKIGILGFSFLYVLIPWFFIYKIYLKDTSLSYIVLLFCMIWGSDIGGYFGGRFFGKRKLAEKISPKKTIEGAICSLVSSVVLYLVFLKIFSVNQNIFVALLVAIVVSVFGIAGDLVESSIKRFCEVKDSGKILPGHGGLLDRVDALMFGAYIYYFLLIVF